MKGTRDADSRRVRLAWSSSPARVLNDGISIEKLAGLINAASRPDDVQVAGYVVNTDLHRSNRNDISVTVNGRWIQDSNLSYAIEQGYSNSLLMGRRSIAVLHLVVPAETVDVNAHTTKRGHLCTSLPLPIGDTRVSC